MKRLYLPDDASSPGTLYLTLMAFQDLKDLEDCVSELQPGVFPDGFENSLFTGEYLMPTDMIEGDPADAAGGSVGRGGEGRVVDVI